jgi:hypothetical protein
MIGKTVVTNDGLRGRVVSRAGDWKQPGERGYYSVSIFTRPARGPDASRATKIRVYHKSALRPV